MPSRLPPDGGGEGFGIVYLEAAAHGLPVVAGNVAGARDAVADGETGLLVDPTDPLAVADAATSLLLDPETADAVGRKRGGTRRRVCVAEIARRVEALVLELRNSRTGEVRAVRVLYLNHTGETSGAERSLLTLLEGLPDDVWPLVACPDGPLVAAASSLGVPVELVAGTNASLRLHPVRTPRAIGEILASAWRVRGVGRSRGRGPGARQLGAGGADRGARQAARRPAGRRGGSRLPAAHADIEADRADDLGERGHGLRLLALRRGALRATSRAGSRPGGLQPDRPGSIQPRPHRPRAGALAARVLGFDLPLGVVGQITPWKAQDDAVWMVARLKVDHPEVRLLLVGSAKFASVRYDNQAFARQVEELVAALGVEEHVVWLGERTDIPEILRALDVVLVPSWEEPFGMAVIESMAMEVPVLATAVGGATEVVTRPGTAFSFRPDNRPNGPGRSRVCWSGHSSGSRLARRRAAGWPSS